MNCFIRANGLLTYPTSRAIIATDLKCKQAHPFEELHFAIRAFGLGRFDRVSSVLYRSESCLQLSEGLSLITGLLDEVSGQ
jgi:hypothetical protein